MMGNTIDGIYERVCQAHKEIDNQRLTLMIIEK